MTRVLRIISLVIMTSMALQVIATNLLFAAEDLVLPLQRINPGSILYDAKRLWEKGSIFLAFSENSKYKYHKGLLVKRMSELKYSVETNNLDAMEKASQRVSYEAGILQEKFGDSEVERKTEIKNKFESYINYLPVLRDKFPANSSNWLFIQQNIETLQILSQKLIDSE